MTRGKIDKLEKKLNSLILLIRESDSEPVLLQRIRRFAYFEKRYMKLTGIHYNPVVSSVQEENNGDYQW